MEFPVTHSVWLAQALSPYSLQEIECGEGPAWLGHRRQKKILEKIPEVFSKRSDRGDRDDITQAGQ